MNFLDPRSETVDLDNCAREPIHIPGAIQPHGALIVCEEASLVVTHCSESVLEHLGKTPAELLGQPISKIFDGLGAAAIDTVKNEPVLRATNPLRLTASSNGRVFEAVLHRPPGDGKLLAIELEPLPPQHQGPSTFDPRLRSSIIRLQSADGLASLNQIAAEEVRTLTGFDRVMVYRFDAAWNGDVVAEARRPDLDSLLNMHYPASDIPVQARKLYELNWLRLIAQVDYTPSPMSALPEHAQAPLDMSFAVLRSVSPIHLEYLRNMGVTASMSISLIKDGKLTGLIACHGYSGKVIVPYAIRETVEYLGQALSWHGNVLQAASLAEKLREVQVHEGGLMRSMTLTSDLLEGLAIDELYSLANASGASVVLVEGARNIGKTPHSAEVAQIVAHLRTLETDVFVTDKLEDHIPAAHAWRSSAAGLLAVAISRELGEFLLWYRPEVERTIDWAGNPHHQKLTQVEGAAPRLSPRGSFALWRETVRGRSLPWAPWEIEGASSLRRILLGGIRRRAVELRTMNNRLVEADRAKDNFIATVSHELRTPLNAISGWAHLLRKNSVAPEKTGHALEVIARNADAQVQLVEDLLDVSRMTSGKLTLDVETVDLADIVESVVESTALAAESRSLKIQSVLDPRASPVLGDPTRLRQVVTNLVGNALKFTPKGGWIRVGLRKRESEIELSVEDNGQGIHKDFLPQVFEAFQQADGGMNRRSQGLGLGLAITRKLVELHGGRVLVHSEGEGKGSVFYVRLPLAPVQKDPEPPPPSPSEGVDKPAELQGLRILVVEDEPDARDMLEYILAQCGAAITTAPDAKTALALAENASRFDIIVSDIGLPDMDGLEMIKKLRTRPPERGGRLPAVALTAYTRGTDRTRSLQSGFQSHVPKPVDPNELVAVIASLVRRHP